MDTASHVIVGISLAGLACTVPDIAQNTELSQAILIGTLIGANAPDFDCITRVKGISSYIKNHRGITHSLPLLLIWTLVISFFLIEIFSLQDYWLTLFSFTFISVLSHVFLDSLNAYGVQSLRPVKRDWIHLDVLNIFEPLLFIIHLIGVIQWLIFKCSTNIFIYIYAISFMYIFLRMFWHQKVINNLKKIYDIEGIYYAYPTFNLFKWSYVIDTESYFYTGTIKYKHIIIEDKHKKIDNNNPIVLATLNTDGVRTFLKFAKTCHVNFINNPDGYEVKWSDVRFWYNFKFPFGVDIVLDNNYNVISQKLIWRKKIWEPPYV